MKTNRFSLGLMPIRLFRLEEFLQTAFVFEPYMPRSGSRKWKSLSNLLLYIWVSGFCCLLLSSDILQNVRRYLKSHSGKKCTYIVYFRNKTDEEQPLSQSITEQGKLFVPFNLSEAFQWVKNVETMSHHCRFIVRKANVMCLRLKETVKLVE